MAEREGVSEWRGLENTSVSCIPVKQATGCMPLANNGGHTRTKLNSFSQLRGPWVEALCVCVPLRALLMQLLWYKGSAVFGTRAVILWSPDSSSSIIWALFAPRLNICLFLPFFILRTVNTLHLKCLVLEYQHCVQWRQWVKSDVTAQQEAAFKHLLFDRTDWAYSMFLNPAVGVSFCLFSAHL